jgi:tryptophanyl-tRNA synthetase
MSASSNHTPREARHRPSRCPSELEAAIARDPAAFRVLTGDRPTGPLHLGHYFGTLENRVRLQRLGVELYVLIADYQTLTDRDSPANLPRDVLALVADYLAVGLDPERTTIFAHSQIEPLNQLLLPFLSLVSVAEVGRNPTVKREIAASGRKATNALMFTYPVHQAADILFCHANLVPVGRDQLPHLELTRTIARRFNDRYSPERPYFPAPEPLLSTASLVLGLDGQKMSKSRQNGVPLGATADATAALIRGATTDSERTITYEPARRPEISNLVLLTALCQGRSPEAVAAEIGDGGAATLKRVLIECINDHFQPIRTRRMELLRDHAYLRHALHQGNARARVVAEKTLREVRELMYTVC